LPAGLFGAVGLCDAHSCSTPATGVTVTITQGLVTLQAMSTSDGSYSFPVGGGLVGPSYCQVSTTAPADYVPWQGAVFLTPGLNGPRFLGLIGPVGMP
jgi:hypothetical protein